MPSTPPLPSWDFQPLDKHHDRTAFSCGNQTLDHYLQKLARQDAIRNIAAPFVLVDTVAPKTILGYYTLSAFSVDLGEWPEEVARKLPSYPNVPVILLGRLGVDQGQQGKEFGELLLMNALYRARDLSSQIGATAVVVDAINNQAVRFYRHFNFLPFPNKLNRLFLPMKTIAAL